MPQRYRTNDESDWSLSFGQNLQRVLQTKNIQQQYLARKLGTTDAMISRYIYGISIPSVYKVCQIAKIIGCEIGDLVKPSYSD